MEFLMKLSILKSNDHEKVIIMSMKKKKLFSKQIFEQYLQCYVCVHAQMQF